MSLSDRLRAEARTIQPAVDPALVGRIQAAVRAAGARPLLLPRPSPVRWLAAAAAMVIAGSLLWLLPTRGPVTEPVPSAKLPIKPPAHFAVPAPPTLDDLLARVPAPRPLTGEITALGNDLTAVARALRDAVPF